MSTPASPDTTPSADASLARRGPLINLATWVVVLLLLVIPTLSSWVYFDQMEGQGWRTQAAYLGSKAIQALIPFLWVAIVLRGAWGWPRWSWKSLLQGGLFGLVTIAGMLWLYHIHLEGTAILADTPAQIMLKLRDFNIVTPMRFLGMALFLSFLHAAFEEYYWRWFIFGQLRERLPLAAALAASALGFAAHHVIIVDKYVPRDYFLTVTLPATLAVAVGGGVWAWIYHRTGSILGAWAAHVLADLGLMWIGFHLCRGSLS